jgi:hypothetical protein
MRRRCFFVALILMFLLPGAVAAQTASPTCKIDPMGTARRGETIAVHMHMANDGSFCALSPRVGGGKADSITIVEQPKNGRVEVGGTAIQYTPAPGFEGNDAFLVAWFGRGSSLTDPGANFRTRVEVEVRAKQ